MISLLLTCTYTQMINTDTQWTLQFHLIISSALRKLLGKAFEAQGEEKLLSHMAVETPVRGKLSIVPRAWEQLHNFILPCYIVVSASRHWSPTEEESQISWNKKEEESWAVRSRKSHQKCPPSPGPSVFPSLEKGCFNLVPTEAFSVIRGVFSAYLFWNCSWLLLRINRAVILG